LIQYLFRFFRNLVLIFKVDSTLVLVLELELNISFVQTFAYINGRS